MKTHCFSLVVGRLVSILSISGSGVFSCGVKTSAKYSANRLAFSESLLAQRLGGDILRQSGRIRVRGFFLDLIGFQMVWSSFLSVEMKLAR